MSKPYAKIVIVVLKHIESFEIELWSDLGPPRLLDSEGWWQAGTTRKAALAFARRKAFAWARRLGVGVEERV